MVAADEHATLDEEIGERATQVQGEMTQARVDLGGE
jgi:hypothetical protein